MHTYIDSGATEPDDGLDTAPPPPPAQSITAEGVFGVLLAVVIAIAGAVLIVHLSLCEGVC